MALLTTTETSKALKVSTVYVGRLLKEGQLNGVQLENEWLVDSRSIKEYQKKRGMVPFDDWEAEKAGCPLGIYCPKAFPHVSGRTKKQDAQAESPIDSHTEGGDAL